MPEIVEEMRACANEGTIIDYICLKKTNSLDYISYEAILLPEIIRAVGEIAEQGFDAVIIGCCLDPCINALRESYKDIIITGPFEAASSIARSLGRKFSIIATRAKAQDQYLETIHRTGCETAVSSIRYLNLKVMELQEDEGRLHRRMSEEIEAAIREDHADVIVLACTMETGQYKKLQNAFGVPVIDPTVAALKHAEMMVAAKKLCGWSVSEKGSFETPPENELQTFLDYQAKLVW